MLTAGLISLLSIAPPPGAAAAPAAPPPPGMSRGPLGRLPMVGLSAIKAGRGSLRKPGERSVSGSSTINSPPPPGPPPPMPPMPPSPLGMGIRVGGELRKTPLDVAQTKMLQLQWDKLTPAAVASTIWGSSNPDESAWSRKLRSQGIFDEMEDDFRARQLVKRVIKTPTTALSSVLDPKQRERIG